MRTNKTCPLYSATGGVPLSSLQQADEPIEDMPREINKEEEDLVNIDGTKLTVSSKVIKVLFSILQYLK